MFQMDQTIDADGVVRLSLLGELDMAVVARLESRLGQLGNSAGSVRLDLSSLDFMDSTGLRAILVGKQRSEADGWRLEVCLDVPPAVERLFRLAQVEPYVWR